MHVNEDHKGPLISGMVLFGMAQPFMSMDMLEQYQQFMQYVYFGIPTLIIFVLRLVLITIPFAWLKGLVTGGYLLYRSLLPILIHSNFKYGEHDPRWLFAKLNQHVASGDTSCGGSQGSSFDCDACGLNKYPSMTMIISIMYHSLYYIGGVVLLLHACQDIMTNCSDENGGSMLKTAILVLSFLVVLIFSARITDISWYTITSSWLFTGKSMSMNFHGIPHDDDPSPTKFVPEGIGKFVKEYLDSCLSDTASAKPQEKQPTCGMSSENPTPTEDPLSQMFHHVMQGTSSMNPVMAQNAPLSTNQATVQNTPLSRNSAMGAMGALGAMGAMVPGASFAMNSPTLNAMAQQGATQAMNLAQGATPVLNTMAQQGATQAMNMAQGATPILQQGATQAMNMAQGARPVLNTMAQQGATQAMNMAQGARPVMNTMAQQGATQAMNMAQGARPVLNAMAQQGARGLTPVSRAMNMGFPSPSFSSLFDV